LYLFVGNTILKAINKITTHPMYQSFNIQGVWKKGGLKIPKGNQNPYIEEEQTTQRKSTKGQTTIYKTYMEN
jgi:hypothetical protein